jgi:D-alanine-D-alanine ligase
VSETTGGHRRTRLVLVFGGRSAEHEISVASAASVRTALDPERYEVITIGIDRDGRWHLLPALPAASDQGGAALPGVDPTAGEIVALSRQPGDQALVSESGERAPIDVVFPVLHGPYGEDGTIQGMLELAGVPYVGAGVLASAVGMDKAVAKVLFEAAGLAVAPFEVVRERDWEGDREGVLARAAALGLPAFVKPSRLGSSVGVTKVKQVDELPAAIESALSFDAKILVERAITGAREIEVSVLGNDDPIASVPGEIVTAPEHEFYSYEAKYLDEHGAALEIPAKLDPSLADRVRSMAVAAFRAVDAEGMARVDFFVREPGEIIVNEINTIPGFTRISMYPKLWEASGISYRELLDRLVELAMERFERSRKRGDA